MRTAILLVAAGLPLLPQSAEVAPTQEQPFKLPGVTTKIVIAPTTVTDANGQFFSGLLPRDFSLYDNGKLQRISQDVAFEPLSLVVAVQASGNMEGVLPKVQKIGSLLNSQVMGDNGQVAVLCFDHRIQTLTDFTADPDQIQKAFKKLKPGSSSHRLNDAAMEGIRMLQHQPADRRRVLLLVTETRDGSSELHPRDVMTQAEFQNVTIYTLDVSHLVATFTSTPMPPRPPAVPAEAQHMPAGGGATPTTQIQNDIGNGNWVPMFVEIFRGVKGIFIPNPAKVYTDYTGGKHYSFITLSGLEHDLQNIGSDLHSQYLLSYTPNTLNEAGFHEIKVTVNRPDLKIRTRPGYWWSAAKQE
jgi:VWFA-related protein